MNFKSRLNEYNYPVISFILKFGIRDNTPEIEIRFIKILNVSIFFFILYSLGCIVLGIQQGDYFLAWFQFPCLLALSVAILLAYFQFHATSITLVLTILILAFSVQQYYYGGDAKLHMWLFLPIMGTCLAYPPRCSKLAFIMGSIALLTITGVEYLDIPQKVVSPMLDNSQGKANNIFALGLALFGVAFVSRSLLLSAEEALREQREISERLLNNILPVSIAQRLKNEEGTIADNFESCSVLFCDIVGFTELSEKLSATELVQMLNYLFTHFDDLCKKYKVEKIKTIGDAYMVVAGIPEPMDNHALVLCNFAQDMIQEVENIKKEKNYPIDIRVGIHSGPVVAGVIGKSKFSYDLWGDTVNTAARMESHGLAGRIQISDATRKIVEDQISCEARGNINVKGKGVMETYLIE